MTSVPRKIINDPVHGFITIDHPLIFKIIAHPYYQRLRRIHQMAFAQLVYPGATHTRLHHSLGAYHLMCRAVEELRNKGTYISNEEEIAVKAAILLHDIGHGPFSHALENVLIPGISHEQLGIQIMHLLNKEFNGELELAIKIFTNNYHKPFLHQLISGQLDVDRLDYLTRDSFYTGVSEGVIGYDRILKMLIVQDEQLMVEEKGIYSIEKFLVARRQMYWQVYLHKTVLSSEKMLVKIIQRVREIYNKADTQLKLNSALDYFFEASVRNINAEVINQFCSVDDIDILFAIKKWSAHADIVLRTLCLNLLNRKLLRCKLQAEPFAEDFAESKRKEVMHHLGITEDESCYFVFTGEAVNTTYQLKDERINILLKDGSVKDISGVDNPLIHETLSVPVKKFYICQLL
ncbi:MAG: HD domain-containing protein [Parafilimonas sp.]